jgi:hypothetical protein
MFNAAKRGNETGALGMAAMIKLPVAMVISTRRHPLSPPGLIYEFPP